MTPHFHRLSVYGTNGTFQQSHGSSVLINSRDEKQTFKNITDPYPGTNKGDLIPSFVDSLIYNKKPDVTKQEVCDVMAISLAIEKSIRKGSKILVDYKNV